MYDPLENNVFLQDREYIQSEFERRSRPKMASVAEVTASGLRLQLAANEEPTTKAYPRLASYTSPAQGDWVMIEYISSPQNPDGGTYVVIGKVVI